MAAATMSDKSSRIPGISHFLDKISPDRSPGNDSHQSIDRMSLKTDTAPSQQTTTQKQQEKADILSKVPEEIFKKGGDAAVAQPATKKGFGLHNDYLQASDFEALRILGTGTFARVWLARFRDPPQGEKNKVYALKVLRKDQVVKLKQVDHVKHEREILGDVAGHPFITTLITTFSDRDCLYMLVHPPLHPSIPH